MKNNNIKKILNFIKQKKTSYVKLIDISKIPNVIVDYLLIISMDNKRSVESITDDIIDYIYKENIPIKGIDGKNTFSWIVIDLFDYMIHIFNDEDRKYYNLEKNWADGESIDIDKL